MKLRDVFWGVAVLVVAVVAFVSGVYTDQAFPDVMPYVTHHSAGHVDTTELQQAIRVIQAQYVDGNLDTTKLAHGTVQGLISSLNDPFSAYYDPAAYKRLQDVYTGRYSGIGIYLSFTTNGYPTITGTVPGSPAAAAGLQGGDQIVKVGDKDLKGLTSDQASTLIQGPNGSKVTLTIQRGAQTFSVTITRAEIQVPSVRSTVIADHILYVRLYQFTTATFGKGSVQQDFPLNDGADIHLTVKRWYLPNGVTIDHKGLTPDVTIPLASTNDQFDVQQPANGYAKDAQLNSALSVLAAG